MTVSTALDAGEPQAEVLYRAGQDPEYVEAPVDSPRYRVFLGPDRLLVGIQGEGVYTEAYGEVPRVDPIDQDPFDAAYGPDR